MFPLVERESSTSSFLYLVDGYGNFGHKRQAILKDKCLGTISRNPLRGADFKSVSEVPPSILERINAVVITVPDPAKFDRVAFWLSQGKNVLVEKPLLTSPSQLKLLQKIADEHKVVWVTAYNHRNEPHIIEIKSLIDQGFLGNIYHARLCYGFGNVQQLAHTWRDANLGALAEVGSHLIDLTHHFFEYEGKAFEGLSLKRIEWSSGIDHAQFRTKDKIVMCEASMLYWKNTFEIDAFGQKGSLHLRGLSKWGESTLSIRKRALPAGIPEEETIACTSIIDNTLAQDFVNFEERCKLGVTSYSDDLRVITALASITNIKKNSQNKN